MALKDDFEKSAAEVQKLNTRPGNEDLLALYAHYKQATEGDVKGSRPGMLDFKGRAKFDAWAAIKGKNADTAMQEYVALVQRLKAKG
jgi:diazepam-binding inhibitor (GABA receptor modulator, acyl-CoA-binding protein)